MEEVDKIIIDSLRNIECDLEDISSLKEFDPDTTVLAISSCLEAITPETTLPKKLPPSMSARLKIAGELAEHIKNLGFRGDMGYQSILYCNEVEIRRVLMFLIERLPRESSKTVPIEQTGYVPTIVKDIEENLRESLKQMWIPSCLLHKGIREYDKCYLLHSLGNSGPLETVQLDIPDSKTDNEELKYYWNHNVPDVTKQCLPRQLIPSLLFKGLEFPNNFSLYRYSDQNQELDEIKATIDVNVSPNQANSVLEHIEVTKKEFPKESNTTTVIEKLCNLLQEGKTKYVMLQDVVKDMESKLSQIETVKNEEQKILEDAVSLVKLKKKTLTVAGDEEKMKKLKNLVQNAKDRMVELTNQWNEVQTPLLEEYKALQTTLTSEEAKLQQEQSKLVHLKETNTKLVEDLKEKGILEQALIHKCQQLHRTNNRSAYTTRILEIIGNIRKQNDEIQNVLKDTRQIQKEINYLTGQVDRSFTDSDELIFQDARNDETARKAYKLLAALRDECGAILKAVENLGRAERESRNLQEQIETEKAKEMSAKLDRVLTDLAQIQKETQMIMRQSQG